MMSLRRLAQASGDANLADVAVSTLAAGILTAGLAVGLLLGVIHLQIFILNLNSVVTRVLVIAMVVSMVGGFIRAAAMMEVVDSGLKFFLYPTSIPFVLSYLDFISSLRRVALDPKRRHQHYSIVGSTPLNTK